MASVGVDEDEDLTSTITVVRNAVALDRTVDLNDPVQRSTIVLLTECVVAHH